MRILGALLATLLLPASALLAAAWLVPPMLDWDRYRTEIATLVSARLGRPVSIAGPVSLTLLPAPVLTASGVAVAEGTDGIAIRADELRLRISLPALAGGRVDAAELMLGGAEMHVPWPFRPLAVPAEAPGWFASASVRVERGTLTVGGLAFTGIGATLTTDAFTGSYAAAGTLRFSGQPWHFAARLTRAGGDGSAGLNLALDGQGPVQGVGGVLAGQAQSDGSFVGRISGRGPDLSQLLPSPPVPFAGEGRLTVAGGRASVEDVTGDIGGSTAKGSIALRVTPALRMDVAVTAGRLDLDAWLPAVLHGGAAPFPVGIDLGAEAAQLAGGTLRRVRGRFDLNDRAIAVRALTAVLPGEATLGATGAIARPDGGAAFEGDATLAAPALRTTLAWIAAAGAAPVPALPEGVLRRADLAGHVVLAPGRFALSNLSGTVDGAPVAGSLGVGIPGAGTGTGERAKLTAALDLERLDLDPWLDPWLPAGGWPPLAAVPSRLDRFDADLTLSVRKAVRGGVAFGPVALDGAVAAGQVALRRLDLTTATGMHATASGTLAGGRIADLRLDLQGPSAAPLAGLLPAAFAPLARAPGFWGVPVTLAVQAAGPPEALAVKLAGDIGDLRLEAQPLIDLPGRRGAGPLTLRHPGARRLAEAFGLPLVPAWVGDGSFSLIARAALQLPADRPVRIVVEPFDLVAGGVRAGGALTFDGADGAAPPQLGGHVACETLPLPAVSPRATDPLAFAALRGWRAQVDLTAQQVLAGATPVLGQVAGRLALVDGVLRLDGVSGRLAGGALTGTASLDAAADPPAATLAASLAGAALDAPVFGGADGGTPAVGVDLAAGKLDAALSLTASGWSPAALLATMGGEVKLHATDATLAGVSLGGLTGTLPEEAVQAALAGGTTPFSDVDVVLHARQGTLVVAEGRLTGPSGAASLSGSIDLPGDSARLRLTLLPAVADPPEIGLRLTGPLDEVRRAPELASLARWRAELAGREPPPPDADPKGALR